MPLIPNVLEAELNVLSKAAETAPISGEEYNKQFAAIVTKYILTATITTPSGPGTIL